jgi:hypothetical protein
VAVGYPPHRPLEATASAFIQNLDSGAFLAARARVRRTDQSVFVDETDTKELIRKFSHLSTGHRVRGG